MYGGHVIVQPAQKNHTYGAFGGKSPWRLTGMFVCFFLAWTVDQGTPNVTCNYAIYGNF
jgi:uncharacterized membrane protein YecN with MAPEG domain